MEEPESQERSETEKTTCRWCGVSQPMTTFRGGSAKEVQERRDVFAADAKATGTNKTCANERLHMESQESWRGAQRSLSRAGRDFFSVQWLRSKGCQSRLASFFLISFRSNACLLRPFHPCQQLTQNSSVLQVMDGHDVSPKQPCG